MKKTTEAGRKRMPSGLVSLKMFHIPHSKALIIAYLNMRDGLKKFTFNQTDISNQTNIGKTVVRQYMKELVSEEVLNRKGKSFYKVNRQRMNELYYEATESDLNVSESDMDASESDTVISESDTEVSESDAIHSSNLNTIKLESNSLESSKLNTSENLAVTTTKPASFFSLSAPAPDKILMVSGTAGKPLEETGLSISDQPATTTPAMDTNRRPSDSELPEGVKHQQPSLTVPDELTKQIKIAEACREIKKLNRFKPEKFDEYFDTIFGKR